MSNVPDREPYCREISREHPTLITFLLDQSFSMEEPFGGDATTRKMDQLALALNTWLQNVSIRATASEGIRDYIDIAVIGYRTDPNANPIIESPLMGTLGETARNEDRLVFAISEIGENPGKIDKRTKSAFDEETGEVVEFPEEAPVWVDAIAEGGTPMCSALHKAYTIVDEWINDPNVGDRHKHSFPPMIIHISDGESQEGDPLPYAEPIMELGTSNGNVLLFNCHLSMTQADPFLFPHIDQSLPDELAQVLFKMSSPLPEPMAKRAIAEGFDLQPGARGMVFNANMVTLIRFLDIGTKAAVEGLR